MDDTALMDVKEKEVKEMAVLKKDVSMGYVRVKLWPVEEFPGNWATVNDRDITKQRSVVMFKSFSDAGQLQVKNDTVIACTSRPAWVDMEPCDALAWTN